MHYCYYGYPDGYYITRDEHYLTASSKPKGNPPWFVFHSELKNNKIRKNRVMLT